MKTKFNGGHRSRGKIFKVKKKTENFILSQRKLTYFLRKFGVTVISTIFFRNEEGKLGETYQSY